MTTPAFRYRSDSPIAMRNISLPPRPVEAGLIFRSGVRSVLRNRRIHVRPRIDPADDVVDLAEPHLPEVLCRLLAAAAVVAEEGERRALVHRFERRQPVIEGFERRLHRRQRALLPRAHVDQGEAAVAYAFGGVDRR